MAGHGGDGIFDILRTGVDSAFIFVLVLLAAVKGVWDFAVEPFGRWMATLKVPGFQRMFPHRYERDQLREVMRELLDEVGFGREARGRLGLRVPANSLRIDNDQSALRQVVILAAKYTSQVPNTKYGAGDEVVVTNYYIDTMSAVHCSEDRTRMAELLRYLVKSPLGWARNHFKFILTPKDGNPVLASAFADGRFHVVVAKDDREASRLDPATRGGGLNEAAILTNFEGAPRLIAEAKEASAALEGALLDCNCSTGRTLKRAGEEFNAKVVQMEDGKIEQVTRAFVLFRPDQSIGDQPLSDAGIHLYRYLDFTDVEKAKLYQMRAGIIASEAPFTDLAVVKAADKLLKEMRKKNLIKLRAG
jgi:hypothetical protein